MKKTFITIIIMFIVIVGGFIVYCLVFGKDSTEKGNNANQGGSVTNTASEKQMDLDDPGVMLSHGECTGTDKPLLTHSPMRSEDYSMITPYGLVVGPHVTPIDHQYFEPADRSLGADSYPVYAMADATLVDIQVRANGDHRLVFTISCKLFYYYDLLTSLSPEIQAVYDEQGGGIAIPVTAGQEVGRIGGQTLDFAVWDMDTELEGFIFPEHYEAEPWKVHTVDPLMYYTEELRAEILLKYIRTAEPTSGKIDYDIPGKLIGNWFKKDTNWYGGLSGTGSDYWLTHLAIIPDHIDPQGIVVSIGNWPGGAKQFGVKGNAPDPATVGVDSGVVRYELVDFQYLAADGTPWNRTLEEAPVSFAPAPQSHGCILLQLISETELKMETFPNQACYDTLNFSTEALVYER